MFGDLNRVFQRTSSALSLRLLKLSGTGCCLIFTSVCGLQHIQRGGHRQFGLFQSLWFIIVTFSTVGYGDYTPDIWPSQVFIIIMIMIAITVLPLHFEKLGYTLFERNRMGGSYSRHRAQTERHVVVCTTTLQADTIMDFLNEFYAHIKLQDYYVVLLSPCPLNTTMKMIFQVPIWSQRVIYIQGSALKDSDLTRCRMQDAEACFILASRNYEERNAADQHTVMRSWAVKDFAPHCPQYVQIYRPENKFHVRYAEHVVCEDEFKYAILANNCVCPAISTLVTLLLHTSRGQEGQTSTEEWQKLYGRCSGNEFYHIRLGQSQFFGEYEGKTFTYASFHAHRKYGVSLVGIKPAQQKNTILLNPGPRHLMHADDICYYLSITKEENSGFILAHPNTEKLPLSTRLSGSLKRKGSTIRDSAPPTSFSVMAGAGGASGGEGEPVRPREAKSSSSSGGGGFFGVVASACSLGVPSANDRAPSRRPSIAPVPDSFENSGNETIANMQEEEEEEENQNVPDQEEDEELIEMEFAHMVSCAKSCGDIPACCKEFPPITPYVASSRCLCHIVRTKRPLCCLQLATACQHCSHRNATEYNWQNRAIIVCSDVASSGLFNFIVPLRVHNRPRSSLSPIVLLLESKPDPFFLEAISYFPLVYWMLGSTDRVDDLLRAGIQLADHLVVVNKESSNSAEEDALADCNTIVSVQTIFRLFPNTHVVTELSHSSNMRFMQFRADDSYALSLSKIEKKERERGSHMSYMFRLPFASGKVFSASMLDTLLYQAMVKDYLISIVRLLLGIDQAQGSGYLTCLTIKKEDIWIRTYGRLYQKLCSSSCDIPIGIFRTERHYDQNAGSPSNIEENYGATNVDHPGIWSEPPQISLEMETMIDVLNKEELLTLKEKHDIRRLVECHMGVLGLPKQETTNGLGNRSSISYVIINPSYDQTLEIGDIIYLIRPSSLSTTASPLIGDRKRNVLALRRASASASAPASAPRSAPLATTETSSLTPAPQRPANFFIGPGREEERKEEAAQLRPLLVVPDSKMRTPTLLVSDSSPP